MHEKESVQIAAASRRAINTALNGNPGLVGCMPAKVIKVAASLILMATPCRHHAYDMPPACLAIHPQNVRQDDRVFHDAFKKEVSVRVGSCQRRQFSVFGTTSETQLGI